MRHLARRMMTIMLSAGGPAAVAARRRAPETAAAPGRARRWKLATSRTLAVAGIAGALTAGIADPARAERSGTWESDVWYVRWSASNSYTHIEPHMFNTAYAVICRYSSGAPVYYYGNPARNNAVTHNTSYVYASNGSYVGNYFSHEGILFRL